MRISLLNKKALLGLCIASAGLLSACSDSDNTTTTVPQSKAGPYFVSVSGESSEYIMQLDEIEGGKVTIKENLEQLEQAGYTWIFSNDNKNAIGLIYRQGDPGVGLGYQAVHNSKFKKSGEFQISSRFTTYGFFEDLALTAVGGQTPVGENGQALLDEKGNPRKDAVTFNIINLSEGLSKKEATMTTLNQFKEDEIATFSGIVDRGDGTFLTGLVVSKPRDPKEEGGSSNGEITEPNKVWVAALDRDFNVKKVFTDERISYSAGRHRSQYYSQIGIADDNTTYVFSGSYDENTTLPAGVLKINKGADEFDKDYYFNIQAVADNYKFRKVWHITKDYFLLEFYNDYEVGPKSPATRYGIVDAKAKSFNWVKGLPAIDKITNSGLPSAHNGKAFFPVVEQGQNPRVYIIDPVSAQATPGVEVVGASNINAVGYLEV